MAYMMNIFSQESIQKDYSSELSVDNTLEDSSKKDIDIAHNNDINPLSITLEEKETNENFEMNAFKMVILVAHRTKEIEAGMPLYVPHETDKKDMLLALKEVETKALNLHNLEDRVIASYQQFSFLSKSTS